MESRRFRLGLLAFSGLVINLLILGPGLLIAAKGTTDFVAFYAGARHAFDGHLYARASISQTVQEAIGYTNPVWVFVRLPFYAGLLWPLAQVPYLIAVRMWALLTIAGLATYLGSQRWMLQGFVALCWSFPAVFGLASGQDDGILLGLFGLFQALRRSDRRFLSGFVLSLCSIKFHFFFYIPIWIICRREWRLASGALAGVAVQLVCCFAAAGIRWPAQYLSILADPLVSPALDQMPSLQPWLPAEHHEIFSAFLCSLLGTLVWQVSRAKDWELGPATALVAAIATSAHAYAADCILVLPLVSLLRYPPVLSVCLFCPLVFVLLLMGIAWPIRCLLIGLLFLTYRKSRDENQPPPTVVERADNSGLSDSLTPGYDLVKG